ncbi:hypothetical protein [Chryseobacterium sp. MFBS3-17]|uniref:hypothetical protein n=1 Tax=Chryseobacterium sp. MFBS3-17 TaxID=2886689 RepID=UPI001D0F0000|nr:hypothetical protein [Chryseobacterium sp. MFBS3-17]MCC2590951.1 hypothetical protein [Chryseobacterium sp. MFBS3-17]
MTKFNFLTRMQAALYMFFLSVMTYAQESNPDLKIDVDVDKGTDTMGGDWMSNPLVWVIGALVLIVIIALLARGGNRK